MQSIDADGYYLLIGLGINAVYYLSILKIMINKTIYFN